MSADEKPTVEIPAPPPWAIEMAKDLRSTRDEVKAARETGDRLELNVNTLMGDSKGLHERMGLVEVRIAKLESPSNPPPPPLTSERVRALVAAPSQSDLEEQAKLAAVIVETTELKTAIHETRALAERAATKDDLKALADGTATKAEVKEIADKQTTDIVQNVVTSVEDLAARNKTVRYLLIALAGLALVAINQATTYLTRAPQPAPIPTTQQVTK